MQGLTDEGQRIVLDMAARHGVGQEAVRALLAALAAGGGTRAQFSHPDLGGMGQWSLGGMTMVGDMFNTGSKARVDALCTELSGLVRTTPTFATPVSTRSQSQSQSGGGQYQGQSGGIGAGVSLFVPGVAGAAGDRWPAELGVPSSAGSQNDLHYAVFPDTRRLAIDQGGRVTVYDIGDHRIGGFSQQQGGDQSLTFTSQYGIVRVADLPVVSGAATPAAPAVSSAVAPEPPAPAPAAAASPAPPPAPDVAPRPASLPVREADGDIFTKIERLADLHARDILTAEEFAAKKTELLARL